MSYVQALLYLLLGVFSFIYLFARKHYKYWERRGILHEKPNYIYGNLIGFRRNKLLKEIFRDFYNKYKNQTSFIGFFLTIRRSILLLDLELVKAVLIKDFSNFANRGNYTNAKDDPLSAHLFNLDGSRWRTLRHKLTPTFTVGKIKTMLPLVVDVAERFVEVLTEQLNHINDVENEKCGIEINNWSARYTTDIIGSCAFGIEANSLKDSNVQFHEMGKRIFTAHRHGPFMMSFLRQFPKIGRFFGIKWIREDVSDFFSNVVRDTLAMRKDLNIKRKDFLNILIEMENENSLTVDEIAAQSFVFFLAGFEGGSKAIGFSLYELAKNQEIQDRARMEIENVYKKYDDKLTYDALLDLKYIQQILYETMRLYSNAPILTRKTINDYQLPNSQHIIESGTIVIIPVDAIHYDSNIYPEPELFKPERFSIEEIEKRDSMTWIPFGDGPRSCLGRRFAEMQVIIGLTLLLKNFKFSICEKTKIPLEFNRRSYSLSVKDGIHLKIDKIK